MEDEITEAMGLHDPNNYSDPYMDSEFHRQINSITIIINEEDNSLHKQLWVLVATVDSLSLNCNNKNNFIACNSFNCVKCKQYTLAQKTAPMFAHF